MSNKTIELSNMSTSNNNNNNNIEIPATYGATTTGDDENGNAQNDNDDDNFVDEDDYNSDDDDDDDEGEDVNEMSSTELLYSFHSYHAIVKPVTVTMVLAALSVIYINTDQTRQQSEALMAEAYNVWNIDESDSNAQKLGISLANTFIMVCVIGGMTFLIVLLYKYKCMSFLIGYMILSSATLLGLLGGILVETAIEIYRLPVDKLTFYVGVFNFCVVGVYAIFVSKGIPMYITQGYLVCTSVILAWQLSHFDEWTTWALLFMLALYDLCAVLTPCGPLNALVQLMSKEDSPEMPGLLYEAHLPPEARRPGAPTEFSTTNSSSNSRPRQQQRQQQNDTNDETAATGTTSPSPAVTAAASTDAEAPSVASASDNSSVASATSRHSANGGDDVEESSRTPRPDSDLEEGPTTILPLAIARVYRLPIISYASPSASRSSRRRGTGRNARGHNNNNGVSTSPLLDSPETPTTATSSPPVFVMPENPTPKELKANVLVRLPRHGGRIERIRDRRGKHYLEIDRRGVPKRTVYMDRQGKVFAESIEDDDEDGGGDDDKHANSIRLGLGDFVFYSVLVARAAMYSFTTFIACMLVILAGLGGTLVLLSVFHHALPALPISIILAIIFYGLTREIIEPWIEDVLRNPYYV